MHDTRCASGALAFSPGSVTIVFGVSLFVPLENSVVAKVRRKTTASKNIALFRLLVLSGLLACSLAQNLPPAQTPPDHIRGVVINAVTHEPIARALVMSQDRRFAVMTDSQGRFAFQLSRAQTEGAENNASGSNAAQNLPGALSASRPGFLQTPESIVILTPTNIAGDITIPLIPEGRIVGRVVLRTGESPEPIGVRLFRRQAHDGITHWDEVGSAQTKGNGAFRFAELNPGDYRVVTGELLDRDPVDSAPGSTAYGYPPVYYPNAEDFSSAKIIALSPGTTMQADMTIAKRPYYPVKIAVPNAPTIAGLSVSVSANGHHGPGYTLAYNTQPRTIEGLLPDGSYVVEAYNFGQNAANGSITINVRGAPVTNATMSLRPDSSIAVQVTRDFGADARGTGGASPPRVRVGSGFAGSGNYLYVYLQPAEEFDQLRGAVTNPPKAGDDSLTIDGVAPGRYWVKVNTSKGYAASITSGALDLQHQPLVVGVAGTTSPIEITLRDQTAELDGAVNVQNGDSQSVDQAAGSLSNAHIYLVPLPESSGEFRDSVAAADGSFQFQMPPGTYRALAFASDQQLPYRDPEAMRVYDSAGIVLDLEPGQKQKIQLHVQGAKE